MDKGIEMISKMLEAAHTDETVFPPTTARAGRVRYHWGVKRANR